MPSNQPFIKLSIVAKTSIICLLFTAMACSGVILLNRSIDVSADLIATQHQQVKDQDARLVEQSRLLSEQRSAIAVLENVKAVETYFGRLRYWLYDLQVSWLNESEANAEEAGKALEKALARLETFDASAAREMRASTRVFSEKMLEAVDAYVDGNRVLGNSLTSAARMIGMTVDAKLNRLLAQQGRAATELGEKVDRAATEIKQAGSRVLDASQKVKLENDTVKRVSIGVLLGVMFSSALIWIALMYTVSRPVKRLAQAMGEIARESDFTRRVAVTAHDEIGKTSQIFNQLLGVIQQAIGEVNTVVGAVARGDFSKRISMDLHGDLAELKHGVNASADSVQRTMHELNEVMLALAQGNFSRRVEAIQGEFKNNVDGAMLSMGDAVASINQVMAAVAVGDFARRIEVPLSGDLETLKRNINLSLTTLENAMQATVRNVNEITSRFACFAANGA